VAEQGEFGLIRRITTGLPRLPGTLLGPGDDAAVVAAPDSRVVVGTDMLVEGVHFRLDWSSPHQIGRKAAAANLADLAAMGAVPTALVVALGVPGHTPIATVDGLAAGLREEAAQLGAGVVGGDVVRCARIVVSAAALGDLQGRAPVTRAGARPGDVLALCGRLGWSAAGLALLQRGAPALAVVEAHRTPHPPYHAGPQAAMSGATAMIDISDGLLADAGHLAESSTVGIDVWSAALPMPSILVEAAEVLGADPWQWVLTGGEDYALLACFPAAVRLPSGWVQVGEVRDGRGVTVDGRPQDALRGGWQHFS
jgi:thiamine-monophosphate kinase